MYMSDASTIGRVGRLQLNLEDRKLTSNHILEAFHPRTYFVAVEAFDLVVLFVSTLLLSGASIFAG